MGHGLQVIFHSFRFILLKENKKNHIREHLVRPIEFSAPKTT